jgi:hypothetical protein
LCSLTCHTQSWLVVVGATDPSYTPPGHWDVGADSLSVAECKGAGLPMAHLLGGEPNTAGSVGSTVTGASEGGKLLPCNHLSQKGHHKL